MEEKRDARGGERAPLITPPQRQRVRVRVRKRPFWRRPRYWVLGAVLVVLVVAGLEGYRYYSAVRAMEDGKNEVLTARQLVTGNLGAIDAAKLEQAQRDLQAAANDFGARS